MGIIGTSYFVNSFLRSALAAAKVKGTILGNVSPNASVDKNIVDTSRIAPNSPRKREGVI